MRIFGNTETTTSSKMKISEILVKSFSEKNGLQRFLSRKVLFNMGEIMGFHVVGDHFYEPIPNVRELRRTYDENRGPLPAGHDFDFTAGSAAHAARLKAHAAEGLKRSREIGFVKNPYFRMHDAASLYSIIRDRKIRSVVEVGQGYSTMVALGALKANEDETGQPTSLISIDPFDRLKCQGNEHVGKNVRSILKNVQDIPVDEIAGNLGEASLLITDSSHVFKSGSDVECLMRKIYPAIPPGTMLHVHDIYTPYPTPLSRIADDKLFFNEQDHLESFLAFNSSFDIFCPVYWFFKESQEVRQAFDGVGFEPDLPGNSFYMLRK